MLLKWWLWDIQTKPWTPYKFTIKIQTLREWGETKMVGEREKQLVRDEEIKRKKRERDNGDTKWKWKKLKLWDIKPYIQRWLLRLLL